MSKLILNVLLLFMAFFCSVFCVSASDDSCNLLINEINTVDSSNIQSNEFIELKLICEDGQRKDSLQGFKVIGITAGLGNENKPENNINLVVNLWNEKIKTSNLFNTRL